MKKPGQESPELRNTVTMAESQEMFKDTPEKNDEAILQQEEIVLHEDEEEDKDPLGRMSKSEVVAIYSNLPAEEKKMYRELIRNYRVQDKLFGTIIPTYQQVRTVVAQCFPTLPMDNADKITEAQHELLKEERLRAMCRDMGFEMPRRLPGEVEPEVLREKERPQLRFEPLPDSEDSDDESSAREQDQELVAEPPVPESSAEPVKQELDVKPRLATQFRSAKQLRKLLGGNDDCIVTRIKRGGDPLSRFVEDNPEEQQVVELSSDEDLDEVEDLLDDSAEETPVTREQLTTALQNLADSHRVTGERLDTLLQLTEDMTVEQVEEAAVEVTQQFQGIQGWQSVLTHYEHKDIPLILAIGCRKYEEVETLKKRWKEPVSYNKLAKIFGVTKRVIQDGCKTISYRKGKRVQPSSEGGKGEGGTEDSDTQSPRPKQPRRVQTTRVMGEEET